VTRRERVATLVESNRFQRAIVGVIVFNAITLGLETSSTMMAHAGGLLDVLDRLVLAIFIAELGLRFYAHGWKLLRDPWSVFDLVVVAVSVLPASGGLSVLRSMRILRALRLISAVPGMKKVVSGLLSAIPAMLSIILLLSLVLYVGAVLATELYADASPTHFGDLGDSLFTLFQVMTGEAWPDIAREVLAKHPSAWIFFVLFILVSTFVVLNLFTAVVVSAMEPDRGEPNSVDATLLDEIKALRAEVALMREGMQRDGVLVGSTAVDSAAPQPRPERGREA
jgi:voltage-gated sodium channel